MKLVRSCFETGAKVFMTGKANLFAEVLILPYFSMLK